MHIKTGLGISTLVFLITFGASLALGSLTVPGDSSRMSMIFVLIGLFISVLSAGLAQAFVSLVQRGKVIAGSLQWQKAILEGTDYLIISTDLNGTIVSINPAAQKLLGYSAEEVCGKQTPAIWHVPEEVVRRAQELSVELNRPIAPGFEVFVAKAKLGLLDANEWTFVRKDGTQFRVNLTAHALRGSDGAITGFVGIIKDLTESKKQLDAIFEHQQKIAVSAKMSSLGEMAGGIAHEINTPLSVIIMNAEEAEVALGGQVQDLSVAIQSMKTIKDTSIKIAKIISGLRAFSRDASEDAFEPVLLNSIVEETLVFSRKKMDGCGIQLKVEVAEDLSVICRRVQISQVLLNLLNNAVDAVGEVENGRVEILARRDNGKVIVSVTDNGVGIDPEIRDKIMQPFFTTKEIGKGTGLGLSISRGIIEDHGGTLKLEENVGVTTFSFAIFEASQSIRKTG